MQFAHEDVALGHTVECFGIFRLDFKRPLAVLFSELRLLHLAVGNSTIRVIRGLLRVVVYFSQDSAKILTYGLCVVLNRLLDIAKLELVVSLVFAFFGF